MQNISEQQYQKVLQYMEQNQDIDFQQASEVMAKFDYDLTRAKRQEQIQRNGNMIEPMQMMEEQEQGEDDDQQLDKMKKFLIKKIDKKKSRIRVVQRSKDCIYRLCLRFTEKFIPELIKRKIIRSSFYKLYQDQAVIQLRNRRIEDAQLQAKINHKKAYLIIVSDSQKSYCLVQFLKKKKLLSTFEEDFEIIGVIQSELQNYQKLSNERAPSVLIVRENKIEQMQIVERFHNEKSLLNIDHQTIQRLKEAISNSEKRQIQKMKRATEKLFQTSSTLIIPKPPITYEDNDDDEQQNSIINYLKNKKHRQLIGNQNKDYQRMVTIKKQQDEAKALRQSKLEQLKNQRECRKISLPEEPDSQSNIVQIFFRCPNGETVSRKFDRQEKCQLLFNWVDLNQQIQFEDEQFGDQGMRNFDILHSYPPESLKDKLDMQLRKIFEEQSAKVVIKQL